MKTMHEEEVLESVKEILKKYEHLRLQPLINELRELVKRWEE